MVQVLFEPMSMHSASRCVNGTSRYCWVCSFHDDRVQAMPHKLYQDQFNSEFLAKLDPSLKPIVEWLPGFVEEYGDQVLGPDTQFWAYVRCATPLLLRSSSLANLSL